MGCCRAQPRVEIDHPLVHQDAAFHQPGHHPAVDGQAAEDHRGTRPRPAVPRLGAVAFESGLGPVPVRGIRAECYQHGQLVADPVHHGHALLRGLHKGVDVEAAGQLVPDGEPEALLHGHVARIRRQVRGGALRRGGQGGDAAAVRPGGLVRQGPATPELPEQFRVLQARTRLGLDLLELELVAEVGAFVDRFLRRDEPGGVLLRRHQARAASGRRGQAASPIRDPLSAVLPPRRRCA